MAAAHPTGPPFVALRDWLLWVSIGVIFSDQVSWACHICTGTGLARATSAPGPGSLPTHLHRCHLYHDRAQAQLKVVVSPKFPK